MKKAILCLLAIAVFICPLNVNSDGRIAEATSYWLYETGSGKLLAEHQSDKVVPAASLTKLMTCLLTLEAIQGGTLQWNDSITLPGSYVNPGGSSMNLVPSQTVTIRQLLNGLMIVSGNDGAQVLAVRLGGDEAGFVKLMNLRAMELGMKRTIYFNATGLPTGSGENTTSASDVGLISSFLLSEYGEPLLEITEKETLPEIQGDNSKPSTNTLMRIKKEVDGLKTGHTNAAGYCLAATMPFMSNTDSRLIAVVMGTPDEQARNKAAQLLFQWAEANYEVKKIIDAGSIMPVANWKGLDSRPVTGHSEKSVERLIRKDTKVVLTVQPNWLGDLPLRKGDIIGTVTAELPEGGRVSVPLISDTEILELTLVERFMAFIHDAWSFLASLQLS